MSATQMAINQACGQQLAEESIRSQPHWVQDLWDLSQGIDRAIRPAVPLITIGIGIGAGAAGSTPARPGSLDRLDVPKSAPEVVGNADDVLSGLRKGRSMSVRVVGSDAQLDSVYWALTRGGTPIDIPGYKGSWVERGDGVRVGLRDASKSGGRTIDIRYPDGRVRKVHLE